MLPSPSVINSSNCSPLINWLLTRGVSQLESVDKLAMTWFFHLGAAKLENQNYDQSILLGAVCICAMLGAIMITHTTEEVSNLLCTAITGL